jgi:hypothetical protein
MHKLLLTTLGLICTTSCATTKPCTPAGDFNGLPAIKGNKQCSQIRLSDGTWANDGRFVQWHPNGQPAIEGAFKEGRKVGKWTYYDENGKKTEEKTFDPTN